MNQSITKFLTKKVPKETEIVTKKVPNETEQVGSPAGRNAPQMGNRRTGNKGGGGIYNNKNNFKPEQAINTPEINTSYDKSGYGKGQLFKKSYKQQQLVVEQNTGRGTEICRGYTDSLERDSTECTE